MEAIEWQDAVDGIQDMATRLAKEIRIQRTLARGSGDYEVSIHWNRQYITEDLACRVFQRNFSLGRTPWHSAKGG
jgi:hypothetical protein